MRLSTEELIWTQSEDDIALEGVLFRPKNRTPHSRALVWIHRNTSVFYAWPYVTIGRALAQEGYLFLSGNTRGSLGWFPHEQFKNVLRFDVSLRLP